MSVVEFFGTQCPPGERTHVELPIAQLMSGTPVTLPLIVVRGPRPGPTIWLSAAVHGDELNGVDIIRRVLESLEPTVVAGTIIAAPVVNVHGFNTGDRYLPDRRDLNRCFPGSRRGSLGARIAALFMAEVVERSSIGIDLHTGSAHRSNLPQVRGNLDDPVTADLARVFGAPVALHAATRDGSLRQAATEAGASVLLYEGGEALRFDTDAITIGVAGIQRVLAHIGVTPNAGPAVDPSVVVARSSRWVRANRSGVCHLDVALGDRTQRGDIVATIVDPFGRHLGSVRAPSDGIVVGQSQQPLVNRGDAILHIADTAAD